MVQRLGQNSDSSLRNARPLPKRIFDATTEALESLRRVRDQPNQLLENDVWAARQLADFSVWAYSSGAIETISPADQLDTMIDNSRWDIEIQTRLGRVHQQLMIGFISSITACVENLEYLNHTISRRKRLTSRLSVTYSQQLAARSWKERVESLIRVLQDYTKSTQPKALRPLPLLLLDESYQPSQLEQRSYNPPIQVSESLLAPNPQGEFSRHTQFANVDINRQDPSGTESDIDLDRIVKFNRMFYFRRHRINIARHKFRTSKRFDDFKGSYYVPIQVSPEDVEVVGRRESEVISDELWESLSKLDIVKQKDSDLGLGQEITAQLQAEIQLSVGNQLGKETPLRKCLFSQDVLDEADKRKSKRSSAFTASHLGSINTRILFRPLAAKNPSSFQLPTISAVKSNLAHWIRKVPQTHHHKDFKKEQHDPLVLRDLGLDNIETEYDNIPPLRMKERDDHKPCLCPCCFVALPPHLANSPEFWRDEHLCEDLLPYACVHPDCYLRPDPTLFSNKKDWITHMSKSHYHPKPTWICKVCRPSKANGHWQYPELPTEYHLEMHLWREHQVQGNAMRFLLANFRIERELKLDNCVLCGPDTQPMLPQGKTMLEHVAEHMFLVALLAIPEIADQNMRTPSSQSKPIVPSDTSSVQVHGSFAYKGDGEAQESGTAGNMVGRGGLELSGISSMRIGAC